MMYGAVEGGVCAGVGAWVVGAWVVGAEFDGGDVPSNFAFVKHLAQFEMELQHPLYP